MYDNGQNLNVSDLLVLLLRLCVRLSTHDKLKGSKVEVEQIALQHETIWARDTITKLDNNFYHRQVIPTTHPIRSSLVRLLKSSSNWTKLSMMGPQLFSGWYQMILDVFQCSQLFSDVFRLFSDVFRLFSNCFPTMFSDCWNPLQTELNHLWWVLSCS